MLQVFVWWVLDLGGSSFPFGVAKWMPSGQCYCLVDWDKACPSLWGFPQWVLPKGMEGDDWMGALIPPGRIVGAVL